MAAETELFAKGFGYKREEVDQYVTTIRAQNEKLKEGIKKYSAVFEGMKKENTELKAKLVHLQKELSLALTAPKPAAVPKEIPTPVAAPAPAPQITVVEDKESKAKVAILQSELARIKAEAGAIMAENQSLKNAQNNQNNEFAMLIMEARRRAEDIVSESKLEAYQMEKAAKQSIEDAEKHSAEIAKRIQNEINQYQANINSMRNEVASCKQNVESLFDMMDVHMYSLKSLKAQPKEEEDGFMYSLDENKNDNNAF